MILEPWKSAEEIDRRLSALNDPELAELLRAANRGLLGNDSESYTSQDAPYWKRRIGFIALAGLLAMSAGYASTLLSSHPSEGAKPHAALTVPARPHFKVAVHHAVLKRHVVGVAHPRTLVAPVPVAPVHVAPVRVAPVHPVSVAATNEALIRQARAQLLHERALAAQARAETARAQHEAKFAMQQQAAAQAWAQAEALAQARAEAQARAQAEALARAQAENAEAQRAQDQAAQNASDRDIKTPDTPPINIGRMPYPSTGVPVPSTGVPGPLPVPIGGNCTPHRGGLFGAVLDHVRVGGTSVGGLLRVVQP
ncbi:MAG: hypothetical protein ACXWNJ_17300 [Vulcanimicrobiaceae bacterium]